MRTQDIKDILTTIETSIDLGKEVFPNDVIPEFVKAIQKLDKNSIAVMSGLMGMEKTQLQETLPKIMGVLTGVQNFYETKKNEEVNSFIKRLKNRNFILGLIAKFI